MPLKSSSPMLLFQRGARGVDTECSQLHGLRTYEREQIISAMADMLGAS
jgi:hypothetical protein